ncbi:hypothetical protein KEJ51_04200 [Candidatus Bathyarchaeota archaeon]|nr:hypothetical protein [Candidatus Bathyarchaeota archaeon]MBS7628728.1 hypothetical protein [Candidatus Bathyarchaeota archaeon]
MVTNRKLSVCALVQGFYGYRIVSNIKGRTPEGWNLEVCEFTNKLPDPVDDPRSLIPKPPHCDLILSLGEHPTIAALLPEITQAAAASSVICPVDNHDWVPLGLIKQVSERLSDLGVAYVFPKPLCSLQDNVDDDYIRLFAEKFGRPRLRIILNGKVISRVDVLRSSPCGATYFVAERLVGLKAYEAALRAGLLTQLYPCLASKAEALNYGRSLINEAARIMSRTVEESILKAGLSSDVEVQG